jgi:hypothetical protein
MRMKRQLLGEKFLLLAALAFLVVGPSEPGSKAMSSEPAARHIARLKGQYIEAVFMDGKNVWAVATNRRSWSNLHEGFVDIPPSSLYVGELTSNTMRKSANLGGVFPFSRIRKTRNGCLIVGGPGHKDPGKSIVSVCGTQVRAIFPDTGFTRVTLSDFALLPAEDGYVLGIAELFRLLVVQEGKESRLICPKKEEKGACPGFPKVDYDPASKSTFVADSTGKILRFDEKWRLVWETRVPLGSLGEDTYVAFWSVQAIRGVVLVPIGVEGTRKGNTSFIVRARASDARLEVCPLPRWTAFYGVTELSFLVGNEEGLIRLINVTPGSCQAPEVFFGRSELR